MKTYPKMKDSGIDWIGKIPEEWNIHRLKFLADITTGEKDTVDNEGDAEFPFFVRSQKIERISSYSCDEEAVLTAGDGVGVGKVFHYVNGKFDFHQRVYKLSNFKKINGKYFYYFFKENFKKEVFKGTAKSTVDSLRRYMLQNFPVVFGSNDEQTQIVNFLEKEISRINLEITRNNNLIELLKEKRQSLINHVITKGLDNSVSLKDSGVEWIGKIPIHWEVKKIKSVSPVKRGASPRPIDNPNYFDDDGEYAWVRIRDVTASKMYLKKTNQILSKLGSNLSVKLEPGQMFVTNSGTVGRPCITKIKCCIHDGFVYFPKFGENENYYYYVFDLGKCYQGIGNLVTQINLNTQLMENLFVPYPPKNERNKIFEYLTNEIEKIETLIDKITLQIQNLEEYSQSLVTSTVTGKIDVRGAVA